MIRVTDVDVAYGDLQVLWDVSLEVRADDGVVALVGPNGAGKSTLLRAISGLVPVADGRIELFGEDAAALRPDEIVRRGFVQVPEERHLFDGMTVRENLRMGAYTRTDDPTATLRDVYDVFPVLEERATQAAGTLSGGEQQMLAIGRALMADPTVLALDELSVGLAPQLARRTFDTIADLSEELTVVLVEQHVDEALSMADRGYVLENGRIAASGTGEELLASDRVRSAYLG
ncbi:ATP-binding cassette domain-containing protein [Halorubrum sp. JWXQ-INN 858]|uniref:ABC transporter ATP-binding protein n=1 Tax=Halorubrum sp. JWXQ-INN 858 TaxID=2690782 RepID=UPI0013F83CA9|nr:ABC transporter ATP-binding protein [Halorubrum sp. JWXQ-INN 858]MWV65545.1 ATP-binding cassette domain-containing protein [Halorubrum sp. JWXQ-INN 858]